MSGGGLCPPAPFNPGSSSSPNTNSTNRSDLAEVRPWEVDRTCSAQTSLRFWLNEESHCKFSFGCLQLYFREKESSNTTSIMVWTWSQMFPNTTFHSLPSLVRNTCLFYFTPRHWSESSDMCTNINKRVHAKPFSYWFLSDLLNQPLVQHAAVYLHISFPYQSNTVHDTYSWIIHQRYIYIRCRAEPQLESSTGARWEWLQDEVFDAWVTTSSFLSARLPR